MDLISIKWPDLSIELVLFIVTILICHRFIFLPILNILDARRKLTEGSMEKAKEMERKIDERVKTYETQIKKARKAALEQREKLIKEGASEQTFLIHSAKEKARQKSIEREGEEKKIFETVDSKIEVLSRDIADLMVTQYKGS